MALWFLQSSWRRSTLLPMQLQSFPALCYTAVEYAVSIIHVLNKKAEQNQVSNSCHPSTLTMNGQFLMAEYNYPTNVTSIEDQSFKPMLPQAPYKKSLMRQHQSHSEVKMTPNSFPLLTRFFHRISPNSLDTTLNKDLHKNHYRLVISSPLTNCFLVPGFPQQSLTARNPSQQSWKGSTKTITPYSYLCCQQPSVKPTAKTSHTSLMLLHITQHRQNYPVSLGSRGPAVSVLVWLLTHIHTAAASLVFSVFFLRIPGNFTDKH